MIVQDDKGRPRYRGQSRRDVAELAARPPEREPRVIVLRGDVFAGEQVDPETIARWQWAMAAKRWPTLAVYDELSRAASHGNWRAKNSVVERSLREGRDVGVGTVWLTQLPQDVPRVAFHETPAILCFRLDSTALWAEKMRSFLTGGVDEVIRSLPADDVPPDERGQFVLLRRGRPWDGQVYRFGVED